ncbi:MAG: histidinol dehydrogenase, partial [Stackebrandtia sp.]
MATAFTTTPRTPSRVLKARTETEGAAGGSAEVRTIVEGVIADIRDNGDAAVGKYSEKFDRWSPASFRLTDDQVHEAMSRVPDQVIDDIGLVQQQVRTMAERQLASISEFEFETFPGVRLGQKQVPIGAVGAYVPGGRY